MKPIIVFLLFTFFAFDIAAQDYFTINGIILDKKSKNALPFSTVYLAGNKYCGTVSNETGNFILKIPKNITSTDSIKISYLGYKTHSVSLKNTQADKSLDTILLQADSITLKEVTILSISPKELIEKAIQKIPENYDIHPIMLNGFFRQIQEVKPVDFKSKTFGDESYEKEAVLDIYHSPYRIESSKKADNDYLKLIAWRKNGEITDTVFKQVFESLHGSGPNNTINNDPLKDIKSSFLGEKNRKNYVFTLRDISTYDNNTVYVLEFDQVNEVEEQLYKGTLYIDVESLAFVEIMYELSPKGAKFNTMRKAGFMGFKLDQNSKKIQYRKYGYNKWNIYFVQDNFAYNMILYNKLFFKPWFKKNFPDKESVTLRFNTQNQLVITVVEKNNVVKINNNELFNKSTEFKFEKNKDKEDIWGKYNYIKMP